MEASTDKFLTKVFRYAEDDLLAYHVKLQFGRVRKTLSTGCFNRAKAAAKAREIYFFLHTNGWDATLRKYCAVTGEVTVCDKCGQSLPTATPQNTNGARKRKQCNTL